MTLTQLLPDRRVLDGPVDLEGFYLPPGPEHLRVNFVTSLDGAVEVGGRSGPLGGPADRLAFTALRAVADVVLVGAGTVRGEDYGPIRTSAEARGRRAGRGQAEQPALAVVTARGQLDPGARLFGGGDRVLVFTTEQGARRTPELAEVAEVVTCGPEQVDPEALVSALRARGLGRILCEGGPALARSLLAAGQIDELCLTISPMLLGGGLHLMGEEPLEQVTRFALAGLIESDGMLLTRYRTERSGS